MPAEVLTVAVRDARDLVKYWARFPPEHILVRGAIGYDPGPQQDEPMTPARLAESFGGKAVKRGG
jgi:hypothetical protein